MPVLAPGTGRLWVTLRHVPGCIADYPVDHVGELLSRDIDMDQGSTAAA